MAVLILISSSINIVYSQSLNDVFSSSDLTTWIKILEPVKGQTIEIGEAVEVRGEVSAGISKDCHIFAIVNNVKSSQNSVPVDLTGNHPVSQWKFIIPGNHELFNEGKNTITAKLYCTNTETISSYSVMVTGDTPAQIDSVEPMITGSNLRNQGHDYKTQFQN